MNASYLSLFSTGDYTPGADLSCGSPCVYVCMVYSTTPLWKSGSLLLFDLFSRRILVYCRELGCGFPALAGGEVLFRNAWAGIYIYIYIFFFSFEKSWILEIYFKLFVK